MKKIIGIILIIYAVLQSPPLFISNIIVYVSLFLLMALLILIKGYSIPKINYFIGFMVLWILYGLFSGLWAADNFLWFRNNIMLLVILLSLLIFINIIDCKKDIIYFSKVWTIILGISNLAAWYEIAFSKYLFTISNNISVYGFRSQPVFTFVNINDFATYLAISIPFVFLWLNNDKKLVKKSLGYLLILSTILVIYNTGSRGALLALVIGFVFLFGITYIKINKKSMRTLFLAFLAILVVLAIASWAGYLDKLLFKFIYNSEASNSVRINLMKNGLEYLKASKLFGVGSGNVEYWLENTSYYGVAGIRYIHNWWFEVLVNFGLPIFAGYLIYWLKILIKNIKLARSSDNKVSKYLAMAVVIFSIAIISPSSILLMKWLPVFTGFVTASTIYITKGDIKKT